MNGIDASLPRICVCARGGAEDESKKKKKERKTTKGKKTGGARGRGLPHAQHYRSEGQNAIFTPIVGCMMTVPTPASKRTCGTRLMRSDSGISAPPPARK